ncbi:MAG: DUF1214 domain-containing protein [Hyphomicrobiaceae bacterium]
MQIAIGILVNIAVFLALSVGGGLLSAAYMIDAGSFLSTRQTGPWQTWAIAGRIDADPYTRAHMIRAGLMPVTPLQATTWRATRDSSGRQLHSACEYLIVTKQFDAEWWDLAVFDSAGRPIANAADRHAFNSGTVMREPDGSAIITLARDARPGNWLPTAGGGAVTLMLTIQDPSYGAALDSGRVKPLPEITRVACP